MPLTMLPTGRELHCYFRSNFSFIRVAVDLPVLLFVIIYNSVNGFNDRWNDAYDTLWVHVHLAIVVFEFGTIPPGFMKQRVCLPRLEMYRYRAIAGVIMILDGVLVYIIAKSIYYDGWADDFILRLVVVCVLHVINWWRLLETLLNVEIHRTGEVKMTEKHLRKIVDHAEQAPPPPPQPAPPRRMGRRMQPQQPQQPPPQTYTNDTEEASVLGHFDAGCEVCSIRGCASCPGCSHMQQMSGTKTCHASSCIACRYPGEYKYASADVSSTFCATHRQQYKP